MRQEKKSYYSNHFGPNNIRIMLLLDYVSEAEILILVDGKSWDFRRTKIRGTSLASIHIIGEL